VTPTADTGGHSHYWPTRNSPCSYGASYYAQTADTGGHSHYWPTRNSPCSCGASYYAQTADYVRHLRCENCGTSDLSHPENALCDLCWEAEAVEPPDDIDLSPIDSSGAP
jgi:hypothetical protein